MLRVLLVLGLLAASAAAQSNESPRSLSVCWEEGLKPPYLYLDAQNRTSGIAVDLLNEMARREGITLRPVLLPWKRCLSEVEAGRIDLVPNASWRSERAAYALYSDVMYETHLVLLYQRERFKTPPRLNNIEEMKPYRFGGLRGFNYDQYQGELEIDTGTSSRESLLRKLEAGRIDFAIEQLEVLKAMQQRREISLAPFTYIADPILPSKAFHILISRRHPHAKTIKLMLDRQLRNLQAAGETQAIQRRYLGND